MFEYQKYFLIVFVVLGFVCIFSANYSQGLFLLGIVLVVKLFDSNWAYRNLSYELSDTLKIILIVFSVLSNCYLCYEKLLEQPFLVRANTQQKQVYMNFERDIYTSMSKCVESHNHAMYKAQRYMPVNDEERQEVRALCGDAIMKFDILVVPSSTLPDKIVLELFEIKRLYKNLVLNLFLLNYQPDDSYDKAVSVSLKYDEEIAYKKISKIRKMMGLEHLLEGKKSLVILAE